MKPTASTKAPNPRVSTTHQTPDPTEVLVVLPALNEVDHIEACVISLMRGNSWVSGCQIIVADGGSTDGTQLLVQRLTQTYPNLMLIENPGRLQSAGVNAAVARFAQPRHKYLIRCDVHAIYPVDYIKTLADEIHQVGAASVVTAMDATGYAGFQMAAAWIVDTPLGSGGSAHRGASKAHFVDHGHHAAFDLDWFRRIGGYDPSISHNEDAEYDLRLVQAGGTIWLTNRTRIAYVMRSTVQDLWQQYWNYGRGRANTLAKHAVMPRMRQIVPVANTVLLAVSFVALPVSPLAMFWPALYLTLLVAVSAAAVISLRRVGGLWAGPALGAMHLSWGLGFMQRMIKRPGGMRSRRVQNG
ncbi:MAG: glycosyltransferase family 2 protein [Paracoccaceae bacterium]